MNKHDDTKKGAEATFEEILGGESCLRSLAEYNSFAL